MINKFYKTIHNKYSIFFRFLFFLRYLFLIFLTAIILFLFLPNLFNYENKAKIIKNYLAKTYDFEITDYEKDLVYEFYGLNTSNRRIFFSENINFRDPVSFIEHVKNFESLNNIEYKITSFENNKISIEFYSNNEGWLNYIDNYDIFWTARINGDLVAIEKLMNTYKSIKYSPGNNILDFKYEPFKY